MTIVEPWRDRSHYKGRKTRCLECGVECPKSPWGSWCYEHNVERIERINTAFRPFAEAIGKPIP